MLPATSQVLSLGPIDWGTFPDWVAGFSGFGALIAAGVAVFFSSRTFSLQAKQIAELEQEKRAEQASQVGAWFEPAQLEGPRLFHIVNASRLPLAFLVIWVINGETRAGGLRKLVNVPPGDVTIAIPDGIESNGYSAVGLAFADNYGHAWFHWGAGVARIQIKMEGMAHLERTIPVKDSTTYDLRSFVNQFSLE
ncbi:hypothetical protein [Pseudonocardia sp. T1-2H]|uniref:hypothetical protein n=1 Tax=Pseudonocardia sp. T1-2H TaxID=3128899 RepID=UPI0031011C11